MDINAIFAVIIFAIAVAIIILTPLGLIWSLNTLFALGLAYNFWNWLAALFLLFMFGRGNTKVSQNSIDKL